MYNKQDMWHLFNIVELWQIITYNLQLEMSGGGGVSVYRSRPMAFFCQLLWLRFTDIFTMVKGVEVREALGQI